ncbi:aminotransferase class V-fold PLP-dependent enzyme [Marivibrio halodurans]|uniref:Aminotransferase class V-fold PLP-dependent enzyme n=1 Tax=Marivibrio halodurans TaxID=2039722 RepID=A0A8J7RWS7_9PROT|nr:L-aspartate--glyoxylate aminotransferase BhcA [Marivibrio halodurans]MBP5856172.1 aminotransferase class V-fold PLP-dependent enzyme [Marivibrio halodurans]
MNSQNPLFIPGPTNIPDTIRKACDMPVIDHRSAAFAEILNPARANVRAVLRSESAEIFLFTATGTAGWEVALTNTLSSGDRVLAVRNGMFSQRWVAMAERLGLDVLVIDVPWGEDIPAERIADALADDNGHAIKAVLATHNETATGVTSDIAAVRAAIDGAGHTALLFVDGVSSIGSMDFRMDDWGIDVAVAGSQKGFMLPSGLAILGFSAKAMAATEEAELNRVFLDVRDMAASYAKGGYPYTPAVGLLNGLRVSSAMLLEEGLANVFARHARIADGVRAAVAAWNLPLCAARPEICSDTVSAIRTPEGFDAGRIVDHAMAKYGVAFGVGLGQLAGKAFRIGHLGSLTDVMTLGGIAAAEMAMSDLGLPIRPGAGVAAAQEVYRADRPVRAAAA